MLSGTYVVKILALLQHLISFVSLAANCCYKTLEDPQVTQSRLSYLKHTLFDILGTLIQKYGHGLSCTVKMVQVMFGLPLTTIKQNKMKQETLNIRLVNDFLFS